MPQTIKCTAFFGSDEGWGWSETHHIQGSDQVGALLPYLTNFNSLIVDKRRPLLGKDRYCVGVRVSFRGVNGGIASSALRYTPLLYPGNQREGSAPHLSAKVRMGETLNQQWSDINLRGFWDAVEQDEELNFNTAAGVAWKTLLDIYTAALVAGNYGWLGIASATTRRGRITDYIISPDGFITFLLANMTGPALPAVGTVLPFRAARLNNSNSALNRTAVVRVVNATSVETVLRTAALPFTSEGTFVLPGTDFLKYTGTQYTVLARRAAGAPFFHSPGRQKARPRG